MVEGSFAQQTLPYLDLGQPDGQALLLELAAQADMLIEGFRPGTLERWNIGPEQLHQVNSGLVILRYSGFGQTGPYKDRPGFGTIAECMSGYIAMTGFPETPPVLPPIPLADEIAGVFGAMAGMMALYRRQALAASPDTSGTEKTGQVVDLSLFEPLFRLCIPHIPVYDLLGIVRERVGNDFPDAAPRSLYQTEDNRWLGLSATSQSTWEALARAMGLADTLDDPRFENNGARLETRTPSTLFCSNGWAAGRRTRSFKCWSRAGGVVGPVYDSAQIVNDPHYLDREDIVQVDDPEIGQTVMPGVIPKFSETPGAIEHAGPTLGEHNEQVLGSWLGYDPQKLSELAEKGTI